MIRRQPGARPERKNRREGPPSEPAWDQTLDLMAGLEDGDATGVAIPELSVSGPAPVEEDGLARAGRLEREGRLEAAMDLFREVLLADPGSVPARLRLGSLYEKLGEPSLALEHFEAARAIAPDDADVIAHHTAALAGSGRVDQAERELKRALKLHPDRSDLHEMLGMQYYKRGLYGQAEVALRRALELNGTLAAAYHHRGEALNQLGRVDEALEMLQRAVQLEPRNSRAYYTMGILYDKKHLRREAEAMYRRAREAGRS
jgi:tetratricopeptide (TPR) repeat protein